MPEAWLEGPVPGVTEELQPVAHSLVDALREFEAAASGLDVDQVWATPHGAASVGFHLRHVCGAIDRLLTYARGEALSTEQLAVLRAEAEPGDPPESADALVGRVRACIEATIDTLRAVPPVDLDGPRPVGRAGLPSTVRGLLFHIAEHTRRHAGQVIVTAKVVADGASRDGLVDQAIAAWEDAGIRGLCGEGRFEVVIGALRSGSR